MKVDGDCVVADIEVVLDASIVRKECEVDKSEASVGIVDVTSVPTSELIVVMNDPGVSEVPLVLMSDCADAELE